MGYPLDLDNMSDATLSAELARRLKSRREGKCDYCNRARDSDPDCRFPERHHRTEDGPEIQVICGKCDTKQTIREGDHGFLCRSCDSFTLRVPPMKYFEAGYVEVWDLKG